MHLHWMAVTALITAAGFLSGIAATLVGVGGAVVTTPAIRFLGATPIQAVGSTVPAILPGALAGAARFHKEGLVDWPIVRVIAPIGVFSAALGAQLAEYVDGRLLMIITSLFVLWSAVSLLRSATPARSATSTNDAGAEDRETDTETDTETWTEATRAEADSPEAKRRWVLPALGFAAGTLAGLLGIGGGIILTPGLAVFGGLSLRRTIATSLVSVAFFGVTSLIVHVWLGHVDWRFAAPLAVGIVPGARIGSMITVKSSEETMRRIAGLLLLLVGSIYLARELLAL